jgi:two-component system cell cycle sensor histidine kinase PleC
MSMSQSKPGTIMIVEDHSGVRAQMQKVLERAGYATLCARNGSEALEQLGAAQVDLILLDIIMPELDGFALLRRIRKMPGREHTPVIVLSAASNTTSIALAAKLGVKAFLPKATFSGAELLEQIKQHLPLSRPAQKAA